MLFSSIPSPQREDAVSVWNQWSSKFQIKIRRCLFCPSRSQCDPSSWIGQQQEVGKGLQKPEKNSCSQRLRPSRSRSLTVRLATGTRKGLRVGQSCCRLRVWGCRVAWLFSSVLVWKIMFSSIHFQYQVPSVEDPFSVRFRAGSIYLKYQNPSSAASRSCFGLFKFGIKKIPKYISIKHCLLQLADRHSESACGW